VGLFGGRKDEEGATRASSGERAAKSETRPNPEGKTKAETKGKTRGGGGASSRSDATASGVGSTGSRHQATKDRGTAPQSGGDSVANIGKSIVFKGDLTGDEDLIIDGNIEGRVQLPSHQLTIGAHGKVTAEIEAKSVIIVGRVAGNVNATERVEVQASGIVDGDIRSPRLLVQEGAVVNGSIEMSKSQAPLSAAKPEAKTPPMAVPDAQQARKNA